MRIGKNFLTMVALAIGVASIGMHAQNQVINGNLAVTGSVSVGTAEFDDVISLMTHLPGEPPFRFIMQQVGSDDVLDLTYNVAWNGTGWRSRDVSGKPVARLGFENNWVNGDVTQAEFNWDVADSGSGQPVFHRVFNFARATDGQATGLANILLPIQESTPPGFDLYGNQGYGLLVKNPVGFVYDSGPGGGASLDVLTTNSNHAMAYIKLGKMTPSVTAWGLLSDEGRTGAQRFDIRDLTAAADRLEINSEGTIGIGTTPTSKQLAIGGSSDLQVQSIYGWNDLRLSSLSGNAGLKMVDSTGTVTVTGQVVIRGAAVLSDGMQLSGSSQPSCSSLTRGTFWYTPGGSGVKDSVSVCVKNAADVYAWAPIY